MKKFFRFAGVLGVVWLSVAACFAEASAGLEKDLLAYLPLRSDLQDHSAANNPVKVNGNVELQNGGAYFNGDTNWLILPHFDFHEKPFAVSMWIKTTGRNPMYGLVEQRGDNEFDQWLHIMLRGGRQPYLGFFINDAISPLEVPLGRWAHVVFQYEGTHQQLWIDGALVCSREARAYEGDSGETVIGRSPRWNNVPSKDFEGCMKEIRIYGRALSSKEVDALFDLGNDAGPDAVVRRSSGASPSPGQDQAVVGIPFLAINGAKLTITGEPRQAFDILVTSDLNANWQPLVTLTNQMGVVEYQDTEAANGPQRFYRIKVHTVAGSPL
jgi:hypothetical protein